MDDVAGLIRYRKRQDLAFQILGVLCTLVGIATLVALMVKLGQDGLLLVIPGSFVALIETVSVRLCCVLLIASFVAVSVAFAIAVYLDFKATMPWFVKLVEKQNLFRVRLITYGLVGILLLALFLGAFTNTITGGLTMALMITPLISLELVMALNAEPSSLHQLPKSAGSNYLRTMRRLLPPVLASISTVSRGTFTMVITAASAALGLSIAWFGLSRVVRLDFLFANASYLPEESGILMALVGSLCVMLVTFVSAVPLGVAAAVYLEEYAKKNWLTALIEVNISNLAGVPSITYGLMALWLFGYFLGLSSSVLVGGLTLSLLILPIIIVATREALRSIPNSIREAAYASGATKWQTIWYHMLPYSLGGIATGTIIAMSRAVGETAPLIVIGAAGWVSNLPPSPITQQFPFLSFRWLHADFTVLPFQMFSWTTDPDPAFKANAAAAGLVLIVLTLSMNAIAIVVRYRVRRKLKW
jgi:phosphate transport system permease protein